MPEYAPKDLMGMIRQSLSNPLESISEFHEISTREHSYFSQWKDIREDLIREPELFSKCVHVLKRYGTYGMQLQGKGMWLLKMMLSSVEGSTAKVLQSDTKTALIDAVLRICLADDKYAVDEMAVGMLKQLILEKTIEPKEVFLGGKLRAPWGTL